MEGDGPPHSPGLDANLHPCRANKRNLSLQDGREVECTCTCCTCMGTAPYMPSQLPCPGKIGPCQRRLLGRLVDQAVNSFPALGDLLLQGHGKCFPAPTTVQCLTASCPCARGAAQGSADPALCLGPASTPDHGADIESGQGWA